MSNYSIFDVLKDVVKGELNVVNKDVSQQRIEICEICPELVPMIKVCGKCGCLTTAKVKVKEATCPLGKW